MIFYIMFTLNFKQLKINFISIIDNYIKVWYEKKIKFYNFKNKFNYWIELNLKIFKCIW